RRGGKRSWDRIESTKRSSSSRNRTRSLCIACQRTAGKKSTREPWRQTPAPFSIRPKIDCTSRKRFWQSWGRKLILLRLLLGGGLEPRCLSAYAPQTYVSALTPAERWRICAGENCRKPE